MTPALLICLLVVALTSGIAIRYFVQRLTGARSQPVCSKEVDFERYAVMQNLLDASNSEFLRDSGFSQSDVARFRSERRRIFRVYLTNLERDASRVFCLADSYVRQAAAEHPELAERLAAARVRFRVAIWTLRWRLLLHALGAEGVDASEVLRSASEAAASLKTSVRTVATA